MYYVWTYYQDNCEIQLAQGQKVKQASHMYGQSELEKESNMKGTTKGILLGKWIDRIVGYSIMHIQKKGKRYELGWERHIWTGTHLQ